MPTSHFFANRKQGVDKSEPLASWRYGQGNAFAPTLSHPEIDNATQNIQAILSEQQFDYKHPGVVLQSQYKKGIAIVDEEFLRQSSFPRDNAGRIIVEGDGLFTTLKNVPLLNKSGDAHAIIFESNDAIAILVGSWKCLGQDIINLMLDHFKHANIPFDKITVRIGPGLDQSVYAIGMPAHDELVKVYGDALHFAVQLKENSKGVKKYHLNVPQLMQRYAEQFGFTLDASQSINTFDKSAWREVKKEAKSKHDPLLAIKHYQHALLFSARLYIRCDRLARQICQENQLEQPKELAILAKDVDGLDISKAGSQGRYDETGRCLNGIMRR